MVLGATHRLACANPVRVQPMLVQQRVRRHGQPRGRWHSPGRRRTDRKLEVNRAGAGRAAASGLMHRHPAEPPHDRIAAVFINPHRDLIAAFIEVFVQHLRVTVQPADAGAVARVDNQTQRHL